MSASVIVNAYVGLGSNLGDSAAIMAAARNAIRLLPGTHSSRVSPLYRSAPIDASGRHYLNSVVAIATSLNAFDLLDALQEIERSQGRERPYANAPRTLDLDLLLYGDARIEHPRLTVPHPRLQQRAFVLRPLADLSPALQMPHTGSAVSELLLRCAHQDIERFIE